MMFVDPTTHAVVANQADSKGMLRAENGVWVGTLPADLPVANTSVEWQGIRWTQLLWPLPEDEQTRCVLLMHESFHRIQPSLGLWPDQQPDNAHLDTLEGRYWLRLELLALARALPLARSPHDPQGDVAYRSIFDALTFRAHRQALFPGSCAQENLLEEIEGWAEYTGIIAGAPGLSGLDRSDSHWALQYTLDNLARAPKQETFVRSFAYATGPAYLSLFSRCTETNLGEPPRPLNYKQNPDFAALLAKETGFKLPADLAAVAATRAADYPEAPGIRAEEEAREARRLERLAADRKRFVDGPVVVLPLRHMNVSFDPRNLRPLDKLGTVYPTLRISDDWGVLEARDGALLAPDWDRVTVAAPDAPDARKGPGWTLDLKPGWKLSPGEHGNYRLEGP